MPIRPYDPPAESLQALRETIAATPRAYKRNAEMMKEILTDLPSHWPHPVYRAGLKDMIATNGLRKAEMVGWRYLARSGTDRNYAVEIQLEDDTADHCFAELDKGPYIDGFYRVVRDESLNKKIGATVMKPAVLRINAMGIFTVWLRAKDPEHELIIPLPPAPSYLTVWQQYSLKHFQDVVRDRAKTKLDDDFSDA